MGHLNPLVRIIIGHLNPTTMVTMWHLTLTTGIITVRSNEPRLFVNYATIVARNLLRLY